MNTEEFICLSREKHGDNNCGVKISIYIEKYLKISKLMKHKNIKVVSMDTENMLYTCDDGNE